MKRKSEKPNTESEFRCKITAPDITPTPFAGHCSSGGWCKFIDRAKDAHLPLMLAEILAMRRNSVTSEPEKNKKSVDFKMSRIELIIFAIDKFMIMKQGDLDANSGYSEKIEKIFENILENGVPDEWIQTIKILADTNLGDFSVLRLDIIRQLSQAVIDSGLFRELIRLMRILIEKRAKIPGEIIDEQLFKIIEKLEVTANIDNLSYDISAQLKNISPQ